MTKEERFKNLKVGERIYVVRQGSGTPTYSIGEVVKITPTGFFDVKFGGREPIRFRPNGDRQASTWASEYADSMPFEQRAALLESGKRADEAAAAINQIKPVDCVRGTWGKDGLLKEMKRLEALLNEARAKVTAI